LLKYSWRPLALRFARRGDAAPERLPVRTPKDGFIIEQVVYCDADLITAFCAVNLSQPAEGAGCIRY
jgi:hypothetical protein